MEAQDLVKGAVKLIPLPEVFIKVNEMVNDPKSSASSIAKIISHDPALTAQLLKIANSALYSFPSKIDTVSRSVTVIGTRGLRDLIFATSAIKTLSKLSNDFIDMQSFWRHSIYSGVLARMLALKCNVLHAEPFFVAGLLQNIGQLIILNKLPEMAKETHHRANDYNQPLFEIEKEILGFDHAEVGAELLRLWKLPVSLVDAVAYHHTPAMAGASPLGASIVHIADAIVTAEENWKSVEEGCEAINESAFSISKLNPEIINSLIDDARIQFNTSLDLFTLKAA